LLSPPADDRAYWGNWEQDERDNLTLTFPRRDEEIAVRLAGELDSFLAELCAINTVACPPDFKLTLRLEIDPTSLRRLGELPYPLRASSAATEDRISLPTPSLIGKPVDEAGFRALRRGYAGWIGTAIVAAYGLQDDAADSDATVGILAEFGLRPPPVPLQPLPRHSLAGFPAGAPVPEQDVLMLCGGQGSTRLLRFRTDSGRWQEEIPPEQWLEVALLNAGQGSYLSRLPDYSAALIHFGGFGGVNAVWRTYMWQDGSIRLLAEDTSPHLYLPPSLQAPNQPVDRYLVFYVPELESSGLPYFGLRLDLGRCGNGPCSLEPIAGLSIWSPDGRLSVVYVPHGDGGYDLYVGDAAGEARDLIGAGQSVAWLGETSLSYIALEPGAERDWLGRRFGQQVMSVDIDGQIDSAPLFNAESVRQSIPESIRPESLGLWSARQVIKGEPVWIVSATALDSADARDYIVVLDPRVGQASVAVDLGGYYQFQPPMVSPEGGYTVAAGVSRDGIDVSVEMVDTASGEIRRLGPLFPTDWSADDAWLLSVKLGELHLISTVDGQEWPVALDLRGCYYAVWTDR